MILAGDIGGTKTNLALYTCSCPAGNGSLIDSSAKTYLNADFASGEELVCGYLAGIDTTIKRAVFAVAGPIRDGQVKITNLPWLISVEQLSVATGIATIHLMNDLEATAYAVPFLSRDELYTLNQGISVERGNIALIAPGTGLGESFLTWEGTRYSAHATEGSHVDFAPTNALQIKLLDYLLRGYEHVSYERICSGIGIPNIYGFLKHSQNIEEPEWLREQLSQEKDHTAVIVNAALDAQRPCPICRMTVEIFLSVLGAEAGNIALKVMAAGGVYVGGGIVPRILSLLGNGLFMETFNSKGRMSELLVDVPVHIILNPKVAVFGAARYGMEIC
ncbi:glucokinase [Desulfotalea psychrophila]|uniref:Glucokinase n=1 Tax=Desulfotalea psychrophila (strain LSv54 / DSM 12343) TaxID=177439 RepID=Q6APD5_DESPS|nr:glucokinase [Desulfotalea psychrophila]CAG35789.1 probable glucokinase [Desulfotalea psychrophila LSv54]